MAGVALLREMPWGRWLYAIASGMLVYTAIVSPGYFAQEGQPAFLALFAVSRVRGGREPGGASRPGALNG